MITTTELIILALCFIFILNNWLVQKIESQNMFTQTNYTPTNVKAFDKHTDNTATIEESSTQPLSKLDMKKALQQYLDDHLQQHTMQEPTLEAQYSLATPDSTSVNETKKETQKEKKKDTTLQVYGLENWGSDIQPFHSNASNFATI